MRAWDTAIVPLRCSYDGDHNIKVGHRMFVVQGTTWRKEFCAGCAVARQGAPADTGEVLDTTDAPSYPAPLRALAEHTAKVLVGRFDAKAAAAGPDAD